jgi:hypothetical protein
LRTKATAKSHTKQETLTGKLPVSVFLLRSETGKLSRRLSARHQGAWHLTPQGESYKRLTKIER